jgi:thiol-disulfide isomerase/thioredoxin
MVTRILTLLLFISSQTWVNAQVKIQIESEKDKNIEVAILGFEKYSMPMFMGNKLYKQNMEKSYKDSALTLEPYKMYKVEVKIPQKKGVVKKTYFVYDNQIEDIKVKVNKQHNIEVLVNNNLQPHHLIDSITHSNLDSSLIVDLLIKEFENEGDFHKKIYFGYFILHYSQFADSNFNSQLLTVLQSYPIKNQIIKDLETTLERIMFPNLRDLNSLDFKVVKYNADKTPYYENHNPEYFFREETGFSNSEYYVHFWAVWCAPCVEAIKSYYLPLLEQYPELAEYMVFISFDFKDDDLINFLEKYPDFKKVKHHYAPLKAKANAEYMNYLEAIPKSYILDKNFKNLQDYPSKQELISRFLR